MTTFESIYDKLTPGRISPPPAAANPPASPADAPRNISRDVAHELNNVMTIIRGYADRLLMKHGDNPALRPELQLISDNARRAANVVRAASQPSKVPTNISP
jgi:signal transduction histidine kinase